jgi:hypothetical protein
MDIGSTHSGKTAIRTRSWMSQASLGIYCCSVIVNPLVGAGNAFLGGLSAGLFLTNGDVHEGSVSTRHQNRYSQPIPAVLYASVASSFAIEQFGLPRLDTNTGNWNDDQPLRRLNVLRARHAT